MTTMAPASLDFTLNGNPISIESLEKGTTLLDLLRDRLDVISPKNGCQPMGQCGCCTVQVDGRPALACVTPATKVAGKQVITLEGLEESLRKTLSDCFV